MRIPMDLILERLQYLNPQASLRHPEYWVKGIKLLPSRCDGISGEYLYLGVYEDFARVPPGLILAAVADRDAPAPPLDDYILLRTDEALPDIFNELLGLQLGLQNWELELEQALNSGLGPQRLLDLSEPILGNPIVLLDPALKTLACTRAFDTDDGVFSDLLTLGYLTQDNFNLLRQNQYFTPDHYTGETLIIPPSKIKQYTSTLTAILDGTQVRYLILMLFSNYSYSEGTLQLFLFFLEKMRTCLSQQDEHFGEQRDQYEFFLLDLLEGRCTDPEEITQRGRCFLAPEGLAFNCVVIRLNRGTDMYRKHARLTIASRFPRWRPILYRDCILVHPALGTHPSELMPEAANQLMMLTDFLEEADAYAGVSNCFYSYTDVSVSYRQGLAALDLGCRLNPRQAAGRLFWYADYQLFQVLTAASAQLSLPEICNSLLLEVRAYDQIHHTAYLSILDCFLRHERNYTRTAAELHMHRNNVIYHIRRIQELFRINLEDPELRLQLRLSFKALQLWNADPQHR